jgi:SAM-dependent methyltransferase
MSFQDHFSGHAAQYAQFRPRYPALLFEYLAEIAPARERAWDYAIGSGQAAVGLAKCFKEVIAPDASTEQIKHAASRANISYRVAPAERSGLDDASVDLVTVAQALHWFNLPAFYREVQRVLRPRGLIAVWAYTLLRTAPEIDKLVDQFNYETTGPFWPPDRSIVDKGYREIEFPFSELPPPRFQIEEKWNLDQLLCYLQTWSATKRFITARGFDPVDELQTKLLPKWGIRQQTRVVRWPLHLRVGFSSSRAKSRDPAM